MNKDHIQHDGSGPYSKCIFYDLEQPEDLIDYQVDLIIKTRPDFLAPLHIRQKQNSLQVCQDITGLSTFNDLVQDEKLQDCQANEIIEQIERCLHNAADNLLPLYQFSLEPDLIFLTEDMQVKFVFWPVKQPEDEPASIDRSIKELCGIANIEHKGQINNMDSSNSNDKKNLLSYLPDFSTLPRFALALHLGLPLLFLMGLLFRSGTGFIKIAGLIFIPSLIVYDAILIFGYLPEDLRKNISNRVTLLFRSLQTTRYTGQENNGQQTAVIQQDPAEFRIALLAEIAKEPDSQGIRAFVLVAEFLIGRDLKKVDLHLADSGIGRIHARIIRRAGTFFICDQGSKNGTFLDDKRLEKYVETPLPESCVVKFAHRSFNFQVD